MSTQIKIVKRISDKETDNVIEDIIRQVPHKNDVQPKLKFINETISLASIGSFEDEEVKYNKLDNKLYIRSGDSLYSIAATIVS